VRVSLREIALVRGEISPRENEQPLPQSEIDGAFQDVPDADLQRLHQSLEASLAHVAGIDLAVTSEVGSGNAVDFGPLKSLLSTALKVVGDHLATRAPTVVPEADSPPGPGGPAGGDTPEAPPRGLSGEVRSRDDVFKALDKICDYYEKHEPSSPIPLLLRRAQKLSSMTFLEIIRELAPGGLDEAHRAGGIPAE
jgi:type VI secretion system protein ImpA